MRLNEIMTRQVECTRPDASLQDAARRMRELDVGTLPVCDHDRLVGMVTDRDITVRAVADGQDPKTFRVKDAMTPAVHFLFDDQDVTEAVRLMEERQIRRLVVLNRDRRLAGIVSLGDLALCTGDETMLGEALEAISEPSKPGTAPRARA
jgi:CBS domain-containing protein